MDKKEYIWIASGFIIGSIISIILFVVYGALNIEIAERIIKSVTYIFIAGSAVIALLKYNHDVKWNKKHLAFEKMSVYINELEELRLNIDKIIVKKKLIENENGEKISFTDRKRTKEPLKFEEVHKWVCNDYNVDGTDMCSMTKHGVIIIRDLLSIINIYELIAIGIKENILDESLVKESMDNVIMKNFIFFKNYIYHRREKHDDETLGEEWEILYNKWNLGK